LSSYSGQANGSLYSLYEKPKISPVDFTQDQVSEATAKSTRSSDFRAGVAHAAANVLRWTDSFHFVSSHAILAAVRP
jgi:hypothetical protein